MSAPRPRISRRRLLRWGLGGGLLLGAGALLWRPGPGARPRPAGVASLRALDDTEAAILAAVAARLLDPGAEPQAAPPDLARTAVEGEEIVLENLDAIESGRRDRAKLL